MKKAIKAAISNFVHEHIITRFRIPKRLISYNGTPFVNKDVRSLLEKYLIKHRRSTPYYPQGNDLEEATNRFILKILRKMKNEYGGKWSSHLTDVLYACKSFLKIATRFSPFSLVYGIEVVALVELAFPTPRVVMEEILRESDNMHAKESVVDLKGLKERRELARSHCQRYQ